MALSILDIPFPLVPLPQCPCIPPTPSFFEFCGLRLAVSVDVVGAVLGSLLVLLRPSWGHLGPSWGYLGPSRGHLGAILGLSWAILGPSWTGQQVNGRLGGRFGGVAPVSISICGNGPDQTIRHRPFLSMICRSLLTVLIQPTGN